jgi:carboxyl-terminal processing protease
VTELASKFVPMGAIKVTIQKFYRVNGHSTQYKGIVPHLILPDIYEYLETGERFLDYSLAWDEVKPLDYAKWTQTKLYLPQVLTFSRKRVEKNQRILKLADSIRFLKKRKDSSLLPLQLQESLDEQKNLKEEMEKYKSDDVLEKLSVSIFDTKTSQWQIKNPPKKKDKKGTSSSSEKSSLDGGAEAIMLGDQSADWVDGLFTDPYIEESLFVLKDLMTLNGK